MRKINYICVAVFLLLLSAGCSDTPRYKNANAPVEERVNDLLSRMTLEEKAAQLDMLSANDILDGPDKLNEAQAIHFIDSMCIGSIHDFYPKTAAIANAVQKRAIENSRLGIPVIFIEEALHGYQGEGATTFPTPIGNSSSWDTILVNNIGKAIGAEARAHGVHFILGPNLDLARDIRWGRTEETFGEDPYLSSRYAVSLIKGMQGNSLKDNNTVVAEPKHFAIHGIPEGGVNTSPVFIGEREARSTHLYVFEKAVTEAKAKGIMAAYHERDGVPAIADPWLLKDILRDEWKFDGFVVSDLGAIAKQYKDHHTAASGEEAIVNALSAGLDMQFYDYPHDVFQNTVVQAVKDGKLSEKDLDRAVGSILRVKFELGLFDNPYTDESLIAKVFHSEEHRKLALEAARKSIVLLENKGKVLPLKKDIKSIALVGNLANVSSLGGYSPAGAKGVTIYQALKKRFGDNVKINFVNSDISERFSNIPLTALNPKSTPDKNGLDMEFFNNVDFKGSPVYTSTGDNLSVYWHNLSPAPGVNSDNFSVRWSGTITAPVSGEYEFQLNADDYARVSINNEHFIDCWGNTKRKQTGSKTIRMTAGKPVPITLEYAEIEDIAYINLKWRMTQLTSSSLYRDVANAAAASDVTIVVIGETNDEVGESRDRQNLYPHQADLDILKTAKQANKPVVTVMLTGRPLVLTEIAANSNALLQAWYPGKAGGDAVTDVLWGDYNPSGKLSISFPKEQGSLPIYYSKKPSASRRYVDGNGDPLYEFGYGLSYTNFTYSALSIQPENPKTTDNITVSINLRNTGNMDGTEIVQLYINDKVSSVATPVKLLKGFANVFLKAGESKEVKIVLTPEHLSLINMEMKRVVEPGEFEIMVGSSSSDIHLTQNIAVTK